MLRSRLPDSARVFGGSVAGRNIEGVAWKAAFCTGSVEINPNGNLTINYLDTCEAPLSPCTWHSALGFACFFVGTKGSDGERKTIRHALIVENLQQLYPDIFNHWVVANEEAAEGLRWRAQSPIVSQGTRRTEYSSSNETNKQTAPESVD
jgi:hypothetical protein